MGQFHVLKRRATATQIRHREEWLTQMESFSSPILQAAEDRTLHQIFPEPDSRLYAAAGVLCGLSSFLEAPSCPGEEERRCRFLCAARGLLQDVIDPDSPDTCYLVAENTEPTGLVPANGWLAFALLKGKTALLHASEAMEKQLLYYFRNAKRSRPRRDCEDLLYGAMEELVLFELSGACATQNLDYAMTSLMEHSRGDGIFTSNQGYQWGYRNTFMVYPMADLLLPYLPFWFGGRAREWKQTVEQALTRMLTIQARFLSPDGSFPVLGQDVCLRSGVFHTLAHGARQNKLPKNLSSSSVREGLYQMILRTLTPEGTVDQKGILLPGLCGYQPSLCGSDFVRGRLYGCMTVFAPLGLPQNHVFWKDSVEDSPWREVWTGKNIPLDHWTAITNWIGTWKRHH